MNLSFDSSDQGTIWLRLGRDGGILFTPKVISNSTKLNPQWYILDRGQCGVMLQTPESSLGVWGIRVRTSQGGFGNLC